MPSPLFQELSGYFDEQYTLQESLTALRNRINSANSQERLQIYQAFAINNTKALFDCDCSFSDLYVLLIRKIQTAGYHEFSSQQLLLSAVFSKKDCVYSVLSKTDLQKYLEIKFTSLLLCEYMGDVIPEIWLDLYLHLLFWCKCVAQNELALKRSGVSTSTNSTSNNNNEVQEYADAGVLVEIMNLFRFKPNLLKMWFDNDADLAKQAIQLLILESPPIDITNAKALAKACKHLTDDASKIIIDECKALAATDPKKALTRITDIYSLATTPGTALEEFFKGSSTCLNKILIYKYQLERQVASEEKADEKDVKSLMHFDASNANANKRNNELYSEICGYFGAEYYIDLYGTPYNLIKQSLNKLRHCINSSTDDERLEIYQLFCDTNLFDLVLTKLRCRPCPLDGPYADLHRKLEESDCIYSILPKKHLQKNLEFQSNKNRERKKDSSFYNDTKLQFWCKCVAENEVALKRANQSSSTNTNSNSNNNKQSQGRAEEAILVEILDITDFTNLTCFLGQLIAENKTDLLKQAIHLLTSSPRPISETNARALGKACNSMASDAIKLIIDKSNTLAANHPLRALVWIKAVNLGVIGSPGLRELFKDNETCLNSLAAHIKTLDKLAHGEDDADEKGVASQANSDSESLSLNADGEKSDEKDTQSQTQTDESKLKSNDSNDEQKDNTSFSVTERFLALFKEKVLTSNKSWRPSKPAKQFKRKIKYLLERCNYESADSMNSCLVTCYILCRVYEKDREEQVGTGQQSELGNTYNTISDIGETKFRGRSLSNHILYLRNVSKKTRMSYLLYFGNLYQDKLIESDEKYRCINLVPLILFCANTEANESHHKALKEVLKMVAEHRGSFLNPNYFLTLDFMAALKSTDSIPDEILDKFWHITAHVLFDLYANFHKEMKKEPLKANFHKEIKKEALIVQRTVIDRSRQLLKAMVKHHQDNANHSSDNNPKSEALFSPSLRNPITRMVNEIQTISIKPGDHQTTSFRDDFLVRFAFDLSDWNFWGCPYSLAELHQVICGHFILHLPDEHLIFNLLMGYKERLLLRGGLNSIYVAMASMISNTEFPNNSNADCTELQKRVNANFFKAVFKLMKWFLPDAVNAQLYSMNTSSELLSIALEQDLSKATPLSILIAQISDENRQKLQNKLDSLQNNKTNTINEKPALITSITALRKLITHQLNPLIVSRLLIHDLLEICVSQIKDEAGKQPLYTEMVIILYNEGFADKSNEEQTETQRQINTALYGTIYSFARARANAIADCILAMKDRPEGLVSTALKTNSISNTPLSTIIATADSDKQEQLALLEQGKNDDQPAKTSFDGEANFFEPEGKRLEISERTKAKSVKKMVKQHKQFEMSIYTL